MHQLSEQGEALYTELTDSLSILESRCQSEAAFLRNEFFTKLNALTESEILDKGEADRLKQACEDRVSNIKVGPEVTHKG